MARKYRNGINERLIKCLDGLVDEYGIVDISVGTEKFFGVTRERLLNAVHAICLKPHRHVCRFHKDGKWIVVLSCFRERVVRPRLDERFNYILGGESV